VSVWLLLPAWLTDRLDVSSPEGRLKGGVIVLTTQLLPGEGFELIGDSDDCFEDPVIKSRICGGPPPPRPALFRVRACVFL
jgi:hypothetical protein